MLKGKKIVLGVSGGIAAYKAVQLASDLRKEGADIHIIMTKNAAEFVTPLTFETISNNRTVIDTFDRNFEWQVGHIGLAQSADIFVVAPATANVIAKMACGIADDMLTTTFLAAKCPKVVCPAMNTGMYENEVTQRNLRTLAELGINIIDPASGLLACGDVGKGRLPELKTIIDGVRSALVPKTLKGKKVMITAGPTCEDIDPVRFITNRSSGKMGYETARAALHMGAEVTLISGPVEICPPEGVRLIKVRSARDMYEAVMENAAGQDIIIKAAAVGDFRPAQASDQKVKKTGGSRVVELEENPDILAAVCKDKPQGQVVIGFAMETQDLVENAGKKLRSKGADMIVANDLKREGAGFKTDTNAVILITAEGIDELPVMSKYEVGQHILRRALEL